MLGLWLGPVMSLYTLATVMFYASLECASTDASHASTIQGDKLKKKKKAKSHNQLLPTL